MRQPPFLKKTPTSRKRPRSVRLAVLVLGLFLLPLTAGFPWSVGDVVGNWALDHKALKRGIQEKVKQLPPRFQKKVAGSFDLLDRLDLELRFFANGTARANSRFEIPGKPPKTNEASGTWKLQGTRIILTMTGDTGIGGTRICTLKSGKLFCPNKKFPIVLRRK